MAMVTFLIKHLKICVPMCCNQCTVGVSPVLAPLSLFAGTCVPSCHSEMHWRQLERIVVHRASEEADVFFTLTLDSLTLMTVIPSHSTWVTLGGTACS